MTTHQSPQPSFEGRLLPHPDEPPYDQGLGFDLTNLLDRRRALGLLGVGVASTALAACSPGTPTSAATGASRSSSSAASTSSRPWTPPSEPTKTTTGTSPGLRGSMTPSRPRSPTLTSARDDAYRASRPVHGCQPSPARLLSECAADAKRSSARRRLADVARSVGNRVEAVSYGRWALRVRSSAVVLDGSRLGARIHELQEVRPAHR